jgi:hypothetical protein
VNEAGITANRCACDKYKTILTNGRASKGIALHVLSELNARLKKTGDITASCAELTFEHGID